MRTLTYACSFAAAILLIACTGGTSKKDITESLHYWPPMEIDTTELLSQDFFSDIHKNNLGRYVFANETIDREWRDESKFVTVYDMSKMDEMGLFCRLFINTNSGPAEVFKEFAANPQRTRNADLRYDYFIDSIQGPLFYDSKTTKEEMGWNSVRYPIFEKGVLGHTEEEVELSKQQEKIIEALLTHQKYIREKDDNSILLGLKYALADGGTKGKWIDKKSVELAQGQVLLTNVDEGMEWINQIPQFRVPLPYEPNRKLEKEALKLMQDYGRNHDWDEKFKKAIKTSDYNAKRNRYSGIIEGRTVSFGLIAEWPDGSWTCQYFNFYQPHQGNDKYGRLSYNGLGNRHLIWGGAVDL